MTPLEAAYEARPERKPAAGIDMFRDGWNAALEEATKLFDGAWGYDDGLRKGVGLRTVAEDAVLRIRSLKHL